MTTLAAPLRILAPEILEPLLQEIESKVAEALDKVGSSIVVDGVVESEFARTVEEVVRETLAAIATPASDDLFLSVEYSITPDFRRIAESNAEQGRHPAEPLMAAEVVFGVALPLMANRLSRIGDGAIELATALHHALWRRFPPGAIAYVEFILAKLAFANQDSRRRVAGELHDRVAHRLALGMQRIELALLTEDAVTREQHLTSAANLLHHGLEDIQDIAVGLRQQIGDRSLDDALAQCIDELASSGTTTVFSSTGTSIPLQRSIAEELLTIALEAIRNARRHANAKRVSVTTLWTDSRLTLAIVDDGRGFTSAEILPNSLGLLSMEERGLAIGAATVVTSNRSGTKVVIELPLDGPGARA